MCRSIRPPLFFVMPVSAHVAGWITIQALAVTLNRFAHWPRVGSENERRQVGHHGVEFEQPSHLGPALIPDRVGGPADALARIEPLSLGAVPARATPATNAAERLSAPPMNARRDSGRSTCISSNMENPFRRSRTALRRIVGCSAGGGPLFRWENTPPHPVLETSATVSDELSDAKPCRLEL
jgi:hypothetical protein